ncbi:hypothetical protein QZH41_015027 [Actinostola sp. cb2023]|nr:hypothetical protein QZH41_015027 [Actinostola sp. cb2023]
MAYNDYGSYCGVGGSGTPVDGVDRCCQVHDACYDKFEKCGPYYLSYDSGYIKHWATSDKKCLIQCDDTDQCKKGVCECDKAAAECFAKNPYNSNNKNSWWGRRRR